MTDFTSRTSPGGGNRPLSELFLLLAFVFFGYVLGNLAGIAAVLPLVNFDMAALNQLLTNPEGNPNAQNALLLIQTVLPTIAFILSPLAYLHFVERKPPSYLNETKYVSQTALLLSGLLILVFMPFNSLMIQWNQSVNFPDVFGTESWMQAREDAAARVTEAITGFDSIPQLLIGIVVIAVIPAIGEELLFRGMIQRKLQQITGNPHAAVWIAGLIFSAIHLQFYGFVPRALLGVLLGYLYAWSGNLWYPIAAHFTNNAFTLVLMYLYRGKMTDTDITTTSFPVGAALASLLLTVAVLYVLRRNFIQYRTLPYD